MQGEPCPVSLVEEGMPTGGGIATSQGTCILLCEKLPIFLLDVVAIVSPQPLHIGKGGGFILNFLMLQ